MTIWIPDIANRSGPKYLAIADMIGEAISDGNLPVGTKLPPQRNLAYDLGVTLGTITRSYQEATRRGLIGGEVGRGTYVLGNHTSVAPPGGFATALSAPSDNRLDFSLATPALGIGGEHLSRTLTELSTERNLGELLDYQPDTALPRHLEAAATWISRSGLNASASRIAMTNGAQQGIMLSLMTSARTGDVVLSESLTYPGVIHLASQLGLQLHGVAMDEQGMLPDALDEACRHMAVRCVYLMPTLQNPTTATMSLERRQAIVEVARRHDLYILEDDIWGQMVDSHPEPISAMAPERSFYICSLSKCMAGGLRVGFVLAPESRIQALRANVRMSNWMTAPLMAEIARRWIYDGTGDTLISWQRAETRKRTHIAFEALREFQIRYAPDALHLWLDLPQPWRANDFQKECERRGVRLLTAETFTVGRDTAPHSVRICTGGRNSIADIRQGMDIVGDVLKNGPGAGFPVI